MESLQSLASKIGTDENSLSFEESCVSINVQIESLSFDNLHDLIDCESDLKCGEVIPRWQLVCSECLEELREALNMGNDEDIITDDEVFLYECPSLDTDDDLLSKICPDLDTLSDKEQIIAELNAYSLGA